MKITCSKRDDIIKQRDEYQADYDRRKALYEEDERTFRRAQYDQYHEVEEEIKRRLGVLQDGLRVTVSSGWDRGLEVKIDNGDSPHEEGIALSWDYRAKITEDGEVKAETGSWSGLKAITKEQLENLHATVEVLEAINELDWKELLDVATPDYKDYMKHRNPQWDKDKPDFNAMIFEADVEEAMSQNVLLHKKGARGADNYYYKVISETPKNYNVVMVAPWYVENEEARQGKTIEEVVKDYMKWSIKRIAKDKLRSDLGNDYEIVNY